MIICPVCNEYDFEDISDYDICDVCGWENDGVQYDDPDYSGGANFLSQNEHRLEYKLLKNEATCKDASEAGRIHKEKCARIYAKYRGIDYRMYGDKICKELTDERVRYVSILNRIESANYLGE